MMGSVGRGDAGCCTSCERRDAVDLPPKLCAKDLE
jgi:hypothetical protein